MGEFVTAVFLLVSCTPSAPETEAVVQTDAGTESIVETIIISEPIPETPAFTDTLVIAEPALEQPTVIPTVSSEESETHNQDTPGLRDLAVVPRPPDTYITRNDAHSTTFSVEYVPINYYPSLDTDLAEYFKKRNTNLWMGTNSIFTNGWSRLVALVYSRHP